MIMTFNTYWRKKNRCQTIDIFCKRVEQTAWNHFQEWQQSIFFLNGINGSVHSREHLLGTRPALQARKVPGEVPCKHDNKQQPSYIIDRKEDKALIKHGGRRTIPHTHTHKIPVAPKSQRSKLNVRGWTLILERETLRS